MNIIENESDLRELLEGSFSDVHITLVSIIQGAALALLATEIKDFYYVEGAIRCLPPAAALCKSAGAHLGLALGLFCVIVLYWNEYRMGITIYNWIPTLRDCLIPFGLGALEIGAILTFGGPIWIPIAHLAALNLLAVFAFLNMYHKAEASGLNSFVLGLTGRSKPANIGYAIASSLALLTSVAVSQFEIHDGPKGDAVMVICLLIVCASHFVRQHKQWEVVKEVGSRGSSLHAYAHVGHR